MPTSPAPIRATQTRPATRRLAAITAAMLAVLALPLPVAHAEGDAHAGHDMTGHTMAAPDNAATAAYQAANAKMHTDMNVTFTGDADVDFILSMITHHQGAVEMAKIVLEHGKDPEVRKLAEAIIAAQEQEIGWMQDWLARQDQ